MAFVLSHIRRCALSTLCEPKDVGYSCDFSKKKSKPEILVQHIFDSISRSIESPIGLTFTGTYLTTYITQILVLPFR